MTEDNTEAQDDTTESTPEAAADATAEGGAEATPHQPNDLEASPGEKLNPDIEMLMDVNMSLSIEIGRTQMKLNDLLNLSKGAIVELDKLSGEPLDILANGKLIAHGDVVAVNGKYGIRLTDVPKKATANKSVQNNQGQ